MAQRLRDHRTVSLDEAVPRAQVTFEAQPVDEEIFLDVLDEAGRALEEEKVPYGLMGGLASAALGRPRWTRDIDVFVRPEDARRALAVLARAGYATQETNEHWIFKAMKNGVLVDVIFRAKNDIYLDDEMQARIVRTVFKGRPVRTIPPEDIIVIKAIIHDEETPRHWYDALGIIASPDVALDWDYLLRRASNSPRRVMSLLAYAQSMDLTVPTATMKALFDLAYPDCT